MRVLITGGAGFIGSALAKALRSIYDVRILDDFHRGQTPPDGVEVMQGNILEWRGLGWAMRDVDIVIHAAAIAGVGTVVNNPYRTLKVNMTGTQMVLDAMSTCAKQVIYFSTSEVYGPRCYKASEDDVTTQGPIGQPRWVYATSKIAGEHLVHGYCVEADIPYTIIRPFNVYGPGQIGEGAIHWFVKNALAGKPLTVHGDGTPIRSWCYISDCVDTVMACVDNPKADDQIFNVGNPYATMSTLNLAETVLRLTGSSSEIQFAEIAYPEIDIRVPDVSKSILLLGNTPKVGLEDGLTWTIEAMRSCAS